MTETKASARKRPPKSMPSGTASATVILAAADALHAELLAQAAKLMGACEGTTGAAKLERIAPLIEAYETARWPL
jgi:hypothetical protein